MTKIECFGRINLGIIDLSENPYRIDGTHGFYTNISIAEVSVYKANKTSIVIDSEYKEQFIEVIDRCFEYLNRIDVCCDVHITIASKFNRHIGLGSGTQISMAIVEAFNCEFNLEMNIHEKAKLAGSGGTSSVGVYCFKRGGYVLDAGRLFPTEKSSIGPSEKYSFDKLPPIIASYYLPNWNMFLLIPQTDQYIEGNVEQQLFQKYTPIPSSEADEICKWILKGIMPAIVEKNYDSFCYSIEQIMNLGFRLREISHYGRYISDRISFLKRIGAKGVGMSSFGPTVFGFFDSEKKKQEILNTVKSVFPNDDLYYTTPRNEGAKIEVTA